MTREEYLASIELQEPEKKSPAQKLAEETVNDYKKHKKQIRKERSENDTI